MYVEAFDKFVSIFTHPIVQTILCALLGVFVAQWKRYSNFYKEIIDIVREVKNARSDKSPGGKKITSEEYTQIGKQVAEAIEAGIPLFKKKSS